MTIKNAHDKFFKDSFGRLEVARSYLEEYLPPDLRRLVDLDHLVIDRDSFIDPDMQAQQSDLLYQVRLQGGQDTFVYLLAEHKSYVDTLVSLQLLGYMMRIWEREVKNQRPLRPIVPIVIYHGEREWRVATQFSALFEVPEELRPYFPDFQYHLSNFSYRSTETIRGKQWLQAYLHAMRLIFSPHLREELESFLHFLLQLGDDPHTLEIVRRILYYFTRGTNRIRYEDLQRASLKQSSQGKKIIMTIAEELIQKGIEQGRLETQHKIVQIARELLHLHDVVTVSELTGLPLEEVQVLQKSLAGDE